MRVTGTDGVTERRARWKRYSVVIAVISTAYALLVGVVFYLAPELVIPVAIGAGLAVGIASSYLARRTSEQDRFSEQ